MPTAAFQENATFEEELTDLINRHSVENGSDTPDHILASYLGDCLVAFEDATNGRDEWHGFDTEAEEEEEEEPEYDPHTPGDRVRVVGKSTLGRVVRVHEPRYGQDEHSYTVAMDDKVHIVLPHSKLC